MFFILRLSFILKLSVIFYTFHAVPVFKKGKCGASFQGSAKEQVESEIKRLGVENFIKEYKGQEGYVQLSESLTVWMNYIYRLVSGSLKKEQMSRLKWQEFQGTTEEFSKLKRKLFQEGELQKEFISMKGYILFADQTFGGDMLKTYINVSAVLGRSKMAQLKWRQFQGTTKRFSELRGNLLNEEGEPREKYTGMEGYVRFAAQYFEGNMQKTYQNVSAVLGGAEAMQVGLGWKNFQGAVLQYRELKELFDTKRIEDLRDRKGQEYAADTIFKGNTKRTYRNVSALREELLGSWEAFKKLNWQEN